MKYREDKYGNKLSVLGFGCMRFKKNMGRINMENAEMQKWGTIKLTLESGKVVELKLDEKLESDGGDIGRYIPGSEDFPKEEDQKKFIILSPETI